MTFLFVCQITFKCVAIALLLIGSDCNAAPAPPQTGGGALENYLRQADPKAPDEAGRQGRAALPALRQFIAHEDYRVRQLVMRCVGRIGDNQAADVLATGLLDQNINVRLAAADELAGQAFPGAAQAVLQQLTASLDLIVREKLALAAGRMAAAQALPILQSLRGSPEQLGQNVRMALAKLGDANARKSLTRDLGNKQAIKRYVTLEQLIYVDDAKLLLSAKALLSDHANALQIGSLRAPRSRRVCDQAVETFLAVRRFQVNFPVDPERNYSAQELAQIKRMIK